MADIINPTGQSKASAAPLGALTTVWCYPSAGDYAVRLPIIDSSTVARTIQNASTTNTLKVFPSGNNTITGSDATTGAQDTPLQSSHTFTPGAVGSIAGNAWTVT